MGGEGGLISMSLAHCERSPAWSLAMSALGLETPRKDGNQASLAAPCPWGGFHRFMKKEKVCHALLSLAPGASVQTLFPCFPAPGPAGAPAAEPGWLPSSRCELPSLCAELPSKLPAANSSHWTPAPPPRGPPSVPTPGPRWHPGGPLPTRHGALTAAVRVFVRVKN